MTHAGHLAHNRAMTIRFFSKSDTHRDFSNFAPYPIEIGGTIWPTTEHYYQAHKFEDAELQARSRWRLAAVRRAARLVRSVSASLRRRQSVST